MEKSPGAPSPSRSEPVLAGLLSCVGSKVLPLAPDDLSAVPPQDPPPRPARQDVLWAMEDTEKGHFRYLLFICFSQ